MNETSVSRWSIRKDSPTPNELAGLEQVIRAIAQATGAGKAAQKAALSELEKAIQQYRQHYPYVSGNNRTRGSVAKQRESLGALSQALRTSLAAVKSLPLDAKGTFSRRIDSPIGKVTKLLGEWAAASSRGYVRAQKAGDRPVDDAPSLLAFDVARTLQETLQGKITMTSDRNASGARGGAAYCRLLRATTLAAGANPAEDLTPVMREGKKLFESFSIDAE